MTNIIQFKPQAELSAAENLKVFVSFAKDQIKIWSSYDKFDWDSTKWPTHDGGIRFHNYKGRNCHSKELPIELTLTFPFINFAKAYIRHTQNINPSKTVRRTISALMLLERALIELDGKADITKASERHFDKAAEILSNTYKDKSAIGSNLEKIAHNISTWHITTAGTRFWRHPFIGSNSYDYGSGEKKTKLPNDDALLALAEVFANGYKSQQDDLDIYVTCQTCILLSAPQRIGESVWYKINLFQVEKDSQGSDQLFFAYWSPKNRKYVRKEVPKTMSEHAKEAVRRLKKITDEGRELAKHYESEPTRFYRHKNCPDVPEDQILTPKQVVQAVGLASKKAVEYFIEREVGNQRLTGWTLNSLWKGIVIPKHKRNLPHFPFQIAPEDYQDGKPPKMSESLMCFRYRQISNSFTTSPILLSSFYPNRYNYYISPKIAKTRTEKRLSSNFFLKHGYAGLSLKSHQLRHFLNTLAQESGVGIEEITQWSTRASQAQTRTYMHQDPKRKASKIAQKQIQVNEQPSTPVTEKEYNVLAKGPIITTMYGICTHDYTFTPCEKHADCLNCSELLICKGHQRTMTAIQKEYEQLTENLIAANAEVDGGRKVANRWYLSHKKKHERLKQLLKILSDPSVSDGSPVQLVGDDFSHQKRILAKKTQTKFHAEERPTGIEYSDEILECLKLLQEE
jgi:hypothetical protein